MLLTSDPLSEYFFFSSVGGGGDDIPVVVVVVVTAAVRKLSPPPSPFLPLILFDDECASAGFCVGLSRPLSLSLLLCGSVFAVFEFSPANKKNSQTLKFSEQQPGEKGLVSLFFILFLRNKNHETHTKMGRVIRGCR